MVTVADVVIRTMTMDDLDFVLEIDQLSFPQPWPESSYRFTPVYQTCSERITSYES